MLQPVTTEQKMQTDTKTGIELAIEVAGGQDALAKSLGCTQQNVSFWKSQGYVPNLRAVEIEQATGVPRIQLIDPRVLELLNTTSI
jgi:DNA-binding transcriptional regulator YdaS (Cro superfamily)